MTILLESFSSIIEAIFIGGGGGTSKNTLIVIYLGIAFSQTVNGKARYGILCDNLSYLHPIHDHRRTILFLKTN